MYKNLMWCSMFVLYSDLYNREFSSPSSLPHKHSGILLVGLTSKCSYNVKKGISTG